jgi:hypothetical protein
MIGSVEYAERDAEGTDGGHLKVKSLIVPGLEPPRSVKIESRTFTGFARIEQVKYDGDSHGDAWFAELEVTPL